MKNIILFGASLFGKKVLSDYETNEDIKVIAFCDNDETKHGQYFCNLEIISPSKLLTMEYDEIIISSVYDDEISMQLLEMGIESKRISGCIVNPIINSFGSGVKLDMAQDLMFYIAELFNNFNIKYHMDHGTLLGITRDKTILPWDVDIDFASLVSQKDKILGVLRDNLYKFKSTTCLSNDWKYELVYENDINLTISDTKEPIAIKVYNHADDTLSNGFGLDIYLKYIQNNKISWLIARKRLVSDIHIVFPTSQIVFKNKKLNVPNNTELYLESLYGNWKTVVKEWSFDKYSNIKGS